MSVANWDPIQVLMVVLTHVNYVVLKIILQELVQYTHICNKNVPNVEEDKGLEIVDLVVLFYNRFGHPEDKCQKKRDSKGLISVANYSEMLVNNEETTLAKLN